MFFGDKTNGTVQGAIAHDLAYIAGMAVVCFILTGCLAFHVNQVTPAISWPSPSAITYGSALGPEQLNATASVPGTFNYSPAAGSVPAAGPQTLSLTFTPTDTKNYKPASATVTFLVNQATPAISWPSPSAITYGSALGPEQLNATASVPGTFNYSPAAGSVPAAGPQTLSLTFTPTDTKDYKPASATVAFLVNQATPAISWPSPSPITYGSALGPEQLNATASVPGTFDYSPATGTVPAAGRQTLSLTFTPTDTDDYTPPALGHGHIPQSIRPRPPSPGPRPSAITFGSALGPAQLDATASVPGTFDYCARRWNRARRGSARPSRSPSPPQIPTTTPRPRSATSRSLSIMPRPPSS